VRNFGKVFLLPIDLVIGWRLRDERYIRYFDKFAGTTVLDFKPQRSQLAPNSANQNPTNTNPNNPT
jgi:hypothetical protein